MSFGVGAAEIVLVEVIHEPLDHSFGLGLAFAQPLPQADALCVRLARPFRIQELVEDPALQPLAGSEVAEGRAGGLAMVGQNVGVVPVFGTRLMTVHNCSID